MQPVFIWEHVQNETRPVKNSLNKWCTSAQLTMRLSLHGYCKRGNLLIITVVAKTLPQHLNNNLSRIDFRPCSTGTPSPSTSVPQRATISKWACDLCICMHAHTHTHRLWNCHFINCFGLQKIWAFSHQCTFWEVCFLTAQQLRFLPSRVWWHRV